MRATNAFTGAEFAKHTTPLSLPEREQEIISQITSGNVPNFLRKLCPVHVIDIIHGKTNTATFYVTPDYLAIGSDEDYLLMPISPNVAQRIADELGCSLPTRKMVNDIYAAAQVKLVPLPIPPSPAMTTLPVFSAHNATVRSQRAPGLNTHPLGALVAGHKKDVVLSAKLAAAPGKVAIYGWHQTNGAPIQPLYLGHTAAWVDYSQCIRLVQQQMIVNGEAEMVAEVLTNHLLCGLLSDEGPIPNPRYPTNALPDISSTTNSLTRGAGLQLPANKTSQTDELTTNSSSAVRFQESRYFKERTASFTLDPGIKIQINAPLRETFSPRKKVLLIFYALPNGNTTEQTIGHALKPGEDWHYDIQHIGAQTRFLRELIPDRSIVVAYLENDLKSWPAWRKRYGDKMIPDVIVRVRNIFADHPADMVLSGHSGGGSFIFGYLNAVEKIPDDVVRIAFLDSNYAYERVLGHEEKLVRWLRSPDLQLQSLRSPKGMDHVTSSSPKAGNHFLCVLAYNDAAALLDGKSFVSPAGGTWGKSHKMQRDLARDFTFTTRSDAEFQRFSALSGRLQFILKENPDRKILHTVQVERNGFIHSMVSGTSNESKGYEYFGPRAYSKWILSE